MTTRSHPSRDFTTENPHSSRMMLDAFAFYVDTAAAPLPLTPLDGISRPLPRTRMNPLSTTIAAAEAMVVSGALSPLTAARTQPNENISLQLPPTPQGVLKSQAPTPFNPTQFRSERTKSPAPADYEDTKTNASRNVNVAKPICFPHRPSSQITAKYYQGEDMETMKNMAVPDFKQIVNFPEHIVMPGRKSSNSEPKRFRVTEDCSGRKHMCVEGTKKDWWKSCVMCSTPCPRKADSRLKATIPAQNKGLCTKCDVTVWVHEQSNLQIKWCKGCKNFRTWAAFGHKGHLTKCLKCRDDQNKRYARQSQENGNPQKRRRSALTRKEDI